ncbi:MAG: MotA/TolQ/ExbB proton channel family protein [Oligoflexia bacterium]|nr:MotA/TolQ/ExbB proton channel family protein [Oligoflexia bacterium]
MLTQKILAVTQGGADAILYFMIFLSVCSVAVMIERWFFLKALLGLSKKVSERAKEALRANDLKVLDDLSKNHDAIESKMLNIALRHKTTKGTEGLEEVMSGFLMMERPSLEKNLGFLNTLGNNAPFIGLLGTVLGVVKAFADLANSQGNPSVVMAGISEALVATAVGLFVAIPAVASYNYFIKQVKLIMGSAESIKQLCLAYVKSGK